MIKWIIKFLCKTFKVSVIANIKVDGNFICPMYKNSLYIDNFFTQCMVCYGYKSTSIPNFNPCETKESAIRLYSAAGIIDNNGELTEHYIYHKEDN
jgi:hypothetical protein